jgi:hypothetical protein
MAVLHPPVELALARAEQHVPSVERWPVAYDPKLWTGFLLVRCPVELGGMGGGTQCHRCT